ncbi:hypothetical protein V1503_01185 [Bacillus sp. SCS-151]
MMMGINFSVELFKKWDPTLQMVYADVSGEQLKNDCSVIEKVLM